MEVKGLIFDMDGTLIDSMGACRAYKRQLCQQHSIIMDDELSPLLDYHSSWEALRLHLYTHYGLFGSAADFWADFYGSMGRFYEAHAAPQPGADLFLREMKVRGYKLGVATATPRHYATAALERAGLLPFIDAVVSTKDIGAEKGRPDVYLECARRLGDLAKEEVVVFEDDFRCVQTLHTHNFTTVGFRDRHMPAEQLAILSDLCVRTVDDYRELL